MHLIDLLPLLKLILCFCIMLAGIRCKLGLPISVLAGAVSLAPMFGVGPLPWLKAAWSGILYSKTIFLAAIVCLIMMLSKLLDETGQAKRLLDALSGYLTRPRFSLAFFPALIGLLPMPGGAIFSAPMIKNMAERFSSRDDRPDLSGEDLAVINYWFRHVWELAWPLYPGVILTASLAEVPLSTVVLYTLPGPFLCLLLGWLFFMRGRAKNLVKLQNADETQSERQSTKKDAFYQGLPLLIAIGGAIVLEGLMAWLLPGAPFEFGVIGALAASALVCMRQNRLSLMQTVRYAFSKHIMMMVLVIFTIFIFKEVLQTTGAVEALAASAGGGAALFAAAVFLPALVGVISGVTIAFVGAAFPLLIELLNSLGQSDLLMPYVVLGLFSGFAGIMASPIHLCFILSCEYFQTNFTAAWRRMLWPSFLLVLAGAVYFGILQLIG